MTVHTFVSVALSLGCSMLRGDVARDLARERERVAPGLEEVAAYGLAEPDHVQTVRQPGRSSAGGRSRGLPIEFDEVG